jgi:DNA-binding transcriptional LysR family regulator
MPIPISTSPAELRFPSIDALRAFEAVARLGQFERAAEELAVTASAVSKRIGTLEDVLGTALLARSGRVMTLTAHGKEYVVQVRAALSLLAAVPLHQRASQRIHKLRLSTPPTFARQILVPALGALAEACPHIELEVVLSTPFLDHRAPSADIEVRFGDAQLLGRDGGWVPLMRDVLVPMAAPVLIERWAPLPLLRWPLLRSPLDPWGPWLVQAGLRAAEPAHGVRLVDLGLVLEAALHGQGVALARPALAVQALREGRLRPLSSTHLTPAAQYVAVLHAESLAAQEVLAWLQGISQTAAEQGLAALSSLAVLSALG